MLKNVDLNGANELGCLTMAERKSDKRVQLISRLFLDKLK